MKKYILILLVLYLILYNSGSSVAIDSMEAGRASDIRIASDKEAFIGMNLRNIYSIEKGENISFTVENNFPSKAEFVLNLNGDIISEYSPMEFSLSPHGDKEKIEIITDKDTEAGIYQVEGSIYAEFDNGSSDVEIGFEIEVKEPVIEILTMEAAETSESVPTDTENTSEAIDELDKIEEFLYINKVINNR